MAEFWDFLKFMSVFVKKIFSKMTLYIFLQLVYLIFVQNIYGHFTKYCLKMEKN